MFSFEVRNRNIKYLQIMTSYLFADSLDVTFLSGRPHSNAEDEQIENDNGEETSQIYFTEQIHLGH